MCCAAAAEVLDVFREEKILDNVAERYVPILSILRIDHIHNHIIADRNNFLPPFADFSPQPIFLPIFSTFAEKV